MAPNKNDSNDWTEVPSLGEAKIRSPLHDLYLRREDEPECAGVFLEDGCRVIIDIDLAKYESCLRDKCVPASFELAGPRRKIYFDPKKVKAAILTAGGLCPGLNDVIRSLVMTMYYMYGVRNVFGIKHGYQGLIPEYGHPLVDLTPDKVSEIHQFGGSILSSSRGMFPIEEIVDALERLNISLLFTIGGDGTLRGAHLVAEEIAQRGLKIAVLGVPKTIDNDINLLSRSFGFETRRIHSRTSHP